MSSPHYHSQSYPLPCHPHSLPCHPPSLPTVGSLGTNNELAEYAISPVHPAPHPTIAPPLIEGCGHFGESFGQCQLTGTELSNHQYERESDTDNKCYRGSKYQEPACSTHPVQIWRSHQNSLQMLMQALIPTDQRVLIGQWWFFGLNFPFCFVLVS